MVLELVLSIILIFVQLPVFDERYAILSWENGAGSEGGNDRMVCGIWFFRSIVFGKLGLRLGGDKSRYFLSIFLLF